MRPSCSALSVFGKCIDYDFLWLSDYESSYILFHDGTICFGGVSRIHVPRPWSFFLCREYIVSQSLWNKSCDLHWCQSCRLPAMNWSIYSTTSRYRISKWSKNSVLWMDANEFLAPKVLVFSTTENVIATILSSTPPCTSLLPSPSTSFHYFSFIFTTSNFEILSKLFYRKWCKCVKPIVGI